MFPYILGVLALFFCFNVGNVNQEGKNSPKWWIINSLKGK